MDLLDRFGLVPECRHAKPRGWSMPTLMPRGNATRALGRSPVEHVFATRKRGMGLVVRSIGAVRATERIALGNLACNTGRLVWIEATSVPD